MEDRRFDDLAKSMARPVGRRGILKGIIGALFGGALASVADAAAARTPDDLCQRGRNCTSYCNGLYGARTVAANRCLNDARNHTGECYSGCGPCGNPTSYVPRTTPTAPCGLICIDPHTTGCCAGQSYNLATETCCGGTTVCASASCVAGHCTTPCTNNLGYCTYDSQCCSSHCAGGRCCPAGQSLCGTGLNAKCYDPAAQCCSGGVLGTICGAGCIPNTSSNLCCNGVQYAPATQVCCSGTVCGAGQTCVGGQCQSPCTGNGGQCTYDYQCCSSHCASGLCCAAGQSVCGTGANATCYDPATQCCVGGVVGSACGGGCYDPHTQCCDGGQAAVASAGPDFSQSSCGGPGTDNCLCHSPQQNGDVAHCVQVGSRDAYGHCNTNQDCAGYGPEFVCVQDFVNTLISYCYRSCCPAGTTWCGSGPSGTCCDGECTGDTCVPAT